MNYHLFIKDKFFSRYIEDVYDLGLEDNNVFWVRSGYGGDDMFSTERFIEELGNDHKTLVEKLRTLNNGDKLFVSWYSTEVGEAILESGINNLVYVFLMGGEFYAEPRGWLDSWLYDKKTFKKLSEIGYIPSMFKRCGGNLTFEKRLKTPFHYLKNKLRIKNEYKRKLRTIERIDFMSGSEEEHNLIKTVYPTLRAQKCASVFCQNFDLAATVPIKLILENKEYKILVGNSADPANNFIDAYHFIKQSLDNVSYNVYSFLSYGRVAGMDWIIESGRSCFGKSYYPIVDFMDRNTYIRFLQDIDIVIMYHNRQQAYGNIVTSITQGKPVFMKKENVIYKNLKNVGIEYGLYDVTQLGKRKLFDVIEESQKNREYNISILESLHSKENRLKQLCDLFS